MKTGVIMNPVAGGGRLRAQWDEIYSALERRLGAVEVRRTSGPGQAGALAHQMAVQGIELIIIAGGDGTAGEVVDGLLQGEPRPQLGFLPAGTGADFVRSLGLGESVFDAVETLASGRTRTVDAGRVSFISDDGTPAVRHFINVASLGLSGPTDRAVNAAKRRGRKPSKSVFLFHTIVQLLRYRPQDVRLVLDGVEENETHIALVAIANGRYFGGGMMVAPDADLSDGLFDVVVFRGGDRLKLISDLRLVYPGAHKGHPFVTIRRAASVLVEPLGDPARNSALLDIDGESPGRIPAHFEILPNALTIRA